MPAAPAPAGVPWVAVNITAGGARDDIASKLAARLEGELRALGFWPAVTRGEAGQISEALSQGALAAITVTDEAAKAWRVEVRLVDRSGQRRDENDVVSADADAVPVLAVRIVETLRSHLELPTRPVPGPPPRQPPVEAEVRKTTPRPAAQTLPSRHELRLGAGVAALASAQGGGTAWTPTVDAELRPTQGGLTLGVAAFGLGTALELTSPSGSARIWQDLALGRVGWRFAGGRRFSPSFALGLGALRWRAEPRSAAPGARPVDRRGWAAAVDAAFALELRGGERWGVKFEVHVLAAPEPVQFRLLQTTDAVIGGPSLWTNVSAFFTL